jgi:hypothetical protein
MGCIDTVKFLFQAVYPRSVFFMVQGIYVKANVTKSETDEYLAPNTNKYACISHLYPLTSAVSFCGSRPFFLILVFCLDEILPSGILKGIPHEHCRDMRDAQVGWRELAALPFRSL